MQNVSDEYEEMAARAETDFPPSWIATEQDRTIVGTFVRLDEGPSKYSDSAKIAVLDTKDGERSVWLFYKVLLEEFTRARPKRGELVAVSYRGTKKNAAGQPYAAYRVVVKRDAEDAEPDWDSLAAEATEDDDVAREWGA